MFSYVLFPIIIILCFTKPSGDHLQNPRDLTVEKVELKNLRAAGTFYGDMDRWEGAPGPSEKNDTAVGCSNPKMEVDGSDGFFLLKGGNFQVPCWFLGGVTWNPKNKVPGKGDAFWKPIIIRFAY